MASLTVVLFLNQGHYDETEKDIKHVQDLHDKDMEKVGADIQEIKDDQKEIKIGQKEMQKAIDRIEKKLD